MKAVEDDEHTDLLRRVFRGEELLLGASPPELNHAVAPILGPMPRRRMHSYIFICIVT